MKFLQRLFSPIFRMYDLRTPCVLFSTSITYEENKIKVGNCNINYLKSGNGVHSVLCMPGAMGNLWVNFEHQIKGFNREKFTLIAWDPPGCGKSIPPEREYPSDFCEKGADDAFEFMQALNIPKFSVIGCSFGSIASIILAAKYPEAVHKLVIWGARSFIMRRELESYTNTSVNDVSKWADEVRQPLVELYGEERLIELWTEFEEAMMILYNTKGGDLCSEFLEKVKCPTFILYGEKDNLIDNAHVSHLHSHIQGSRIYRYPEGKHNIHKRYHEDFNLRVQDFLLQK